MRIERFEDIDGWRAARELTREIYRVSSDASFARGFGLRDQIRRAAVSIMSNIAEGFGRGGNKEFIQFLSTAKGSASEVQSQLYVAMDVGYIPQTTFDNLYEHTEKTSRLIAGFLRYLQQPELKGHKFN
jgi:four helix bundle protein